MSLSASSDLANVFKYADLDALVSLTAKQTAGQLQDQPMPFLVAQVSSQCAHILAAYRKHCASTMSAGQLVLPDALKLLPLYASCLLKQPPFQSSVNADYRIASASDLVSCSMDALPVILLSKTLGPSQSYWARQQAVLPELPASHERAVGVYGCISAGKWTANYLMAWLPRSVPAFPGQS